VSSRVVESCQDVTSQVKLGLYCRVNDWGLISASEMTYIVSGGALNSTHSLTIVGFLMALSAYHASENYVAVKKLTAVRKMTMLHVWNTYNKLLQLITIQSGLCSENPSTRKISRK